MNKIIEYCYKNRIIASFYCNENDSNAHLTGYIENYNETELLIAHISYYGMYDGYILKRIDDIYRIDFGGKYETKVEKLYRYKKQSHESINILDGYIIEPLIEFAQNRNYVVSFEFENSVISGFVKCFEDDYVSIDIINEYGYCCGRSIFDIEKVDTISVDTDDEQNFRILFNQNT